MILLLPAAQTLTAEPTDTQEVRFASQAMFIKITKLTPATTRVQLTPAVPTPRKRS